MPGKHRSPCVGLCKPDAETGVCARPRPHASAPSLRPGPRPIAQPRASAPGMSPPMPQPDVRAPPLRPEGTLLAALNVFWPRFCGNVRGHPLDAMAASSANPPLGHGSALGPPGLPLRRSAGGARTCGVRLAPDLPLASAGSDMIRWSRVLLSHTLDRTRSY